MAGEEDLAHAGARIKRLAATVQHFDLLMYEAVIPNMITAIARIRAFGQVFEGIEPLDEEEAAHG